MYLSTHLIYKVDICIKDIIKDIISQSGCIQLAFHCDLLITALPISFYSRKASTNSRKSKLQSQTPVLEDGDVSGKDSERNVLSREVKCSGQCSSDDKCCDAVSEQNIETDQTSKQEHHNSAASNEHAQTLTAVSQISKSDASEDNLHSNHHCLPAEKILNQLGSASDSVLTSPLRPSNGKQKINSTSDGSDHLNRSSSAPSLREELQSHKVGVEFTDGLPVSNPILQSPALKVSICTCVV